MFSQAQEADNNGRLILHAEEALQLFLNLFTRGYKT